MPVPPHKLRVPEHLAKLIQSMHPQLKRKVKMALKSIMSDPWTGKALKEDFEGLRSFRVSNFRIIYDISNKREIKIVAIGPREKIYKETYRAVKKEKG